MARGGGSDRIIFMGVIIKLLHRSEGLKRPTHRNLFLDMEENIHIHLRDLRIELSLKEFEDIVRTFGLQSKELMTEINKTDYRDGVLPNTNKDNATIWTESILLNDVVYHPKRISLEECTDGFHLHIRNYKILLDADDFAALAKAFETMDLDAPYASTTEEIMALLDVNHVHYIIKNKSVTDRNNVNATKRIVVAAYHEPKVRGILDKIGMELNIEDGIYRYTKGNSIFHIEISDNKALFSHNTVMGKTSLLPLSGYLSFAQSINPDELNAIKAKVLDTFAFVDKSNQAPDINLDYRYWIYNTISKEVIFPFSSAQNKPDTKKLYREWSNFLTGLDMYFVKPTKITVSEDRQKELYDEVLNKINTEVIPISCVSRIHIMGSAIRGEMGAYKSPFIHSSWAKLGSDYDLLIEIDESQPVKFPESWNYINISKTNQCDIYHIGEIDADDVFEHRKRYPNIDFFQHLLDAYVYIPSKGNVEKKDIFLKKFKAQVIFDRKTAAGENIVKTVLEHEFGDPIKDLARLDVATENELYEVNLSGRDAVLKVYKVSGNYSSKRMAEHAEYECKIIRAAEDRGVPTAPVIPTNDGKNVFMVGGHAAVMFGKLKGIEGGEPNFPVLETAKALARFHDAQIKKSIDIKPAFSFDQVFDLWRVEFHRFADESKDDEKLSENFLKLGKIHKYLEKTYTGLVKKKEIVWLHNHGDITPRNVFLNGGVTYLFDFQNAFYGPRLFDIVEGGIEFSWGAKDAKYNDFKRFDQFLTCYRKESTLSPAEEKGLEAAIKILGIIKFIKEVRMIKGAKNDNNLRRLRALDLADFLLSDRFSEKS